MQHGHLRPKAGTIELQIPRHGKQPARTAEMSVHFGELTLSPPKDKRHLAPIPMWVVFAREELPPKEVKEPLEWMLLTTVAVSGLADALERVQWYARRWGIEVFHRILKSGCQIEDRQLGTADRLEACLAIDAPISRQLGKGRSAAMAVLVRKVETQPAAADEDARAPEASPHGCQPGDTNPQGWAHS